MSVSSGQSPEILVLLPIDYFPCNYPLRPFEISGLIRAVCCNRRVFFDMVIMLKVVWFLDRG